MGQDPWMSVSQERMVKVFWVGVGVKWYQTDLRPLSQNSGGRKRRERMTARCSQRGVLKRDGLVSKLHLSQLRAV